MKQFKVSEDEVGRLDIFVAKKYPDFTRSSLEVLFNESLVKLNGSIAKPSTKLKHSNQVTVNDSILFKHHEIDMPILYEDQDVIVIDKPAGVLTHSKGAINLEATVASFIKPKLDSSMRGNRAGIVHRLDRGTSGLIITAKNEAAQKFLQKKFSTKKVAKTYRAVIKDNLSPKAGIIDVPIARDPRNPIKFEASSNGKSAQTSYRTLGSKNGLILVELKPKTGRTHQLRVHMAYLNRPILGDDLYKGMPADRLMLHATELNIKLPDGQTQTFRSNPPKEFGHYG